MDDLAFSQEADRITHIRIGYYTQDVIVRCTGFLFGSKVFKKVSDGIAFRLELVGIKRNPAGCLRPNGGSVIDIVRCKALGFQLFSRKSAGQLVHDGSDHFHVGQLLGTDVCQYRFLHTVRHGVTL